VRWHGLGFALAGLLVAALDPSVQVPTSLGNVLARVGEYVREAGQKLATVIADEEYVQMAQSGGGQYGRRILKSEIAFLRLPGADQWMAFRDVLSVNGTSLQKDTARLEHLFRDTPESALERARAIADESARFNLGSIRRNLNLPTIPLQFLDPANQGRFRFEKKGEKVVDGERVWVVGYDERQRPTLIRTFDNQDLPARGFVWLSPEDGHVVHTELDLEDFVPPIMEMPSRERRHATAEISVTWRRDDKLETWVPAEMRETYRVPIEAYGRILQSTISGVATYSNVRRFEVDIKMIK
jgi:hypothetical protein